MMNESPGKKGVLIKSDAVGTVLDSPEVREAFRRDLDRGIQEINRRIAAGARVTKLDYVVYVDGEGFAILVDIEERE
jgi:hypothetical protein